MLKKTEFETELQGEDMLLIKDSNTILAQLNLMDFKYQLNTDVNKEIQLKRLSTLIDTYLEVNKWL